jgi:hypothetical protein
MDVGGHRPITPRGDVRPMTRGDLETLVRPIAPTPTSAVQPIRDRRRPPSGSRQRHERRAVASHAPADIVRAGRRSHPTRGGLEAGRGIAPARPLARGRPTALRGSRGRSDAQGRTGLGRGRPREPGPGHRARDSSSSPGGSPDAGTSEGCVRRRTGRAAPPSSAMCAIVTARSGPLRSTGHSSRWGRHPTASNASRRF